MSFFVDVWSRHGFILASDLRKIEDGSVAQTHKIAIAPRCSKIPCAAVFCGDYFEACFDFFNSAAVTGDTLRQIALKFGQLWTERFAGTKEYSAVHLVGFEPIHDTSALVPQMWYWTNWCGPNPELFKTQELLAKDLESFALPYPLNNHIPRKIFEITRREPYGALPEELAQVESFLQLYGPYFTWNGDTTFWYSASGAVAGAMDFILKRSPIVGFEEEIQLTKLCLRFLSDLGNVFPGSSVGLQNGCEADIVLVTKSGVDKVSWVDLAPRPRLPYGDASNSLTTVAADE